MTHVTDTVFPHWLSFTLPAHYWQEISAIMFDLFRLDFDNDFEKQYGISQGYMTWYNCHGLVKVYMHGINKKRDTLLIQVTGTGLETLSDRLDFKQLFAYVLEHGKPTCIEAYRDDIEQILPFDIIKHLSHRDRYKEHLKSPLLKTKPPKIEQEVSDLIRYGRGQNKIIIYNKGEFEGIPDPCTRVEVKIKNPHDLTRLMADYINGVSFAEITTGLIARYLQFVPDGPGRKDRRKPFKWWTEFIDGVPARRLNRPKKVTDPVQAEKWFLAVLKKRKERLGKEQLMELVELAMAAA